MSELTIFVDTNPQQALLSTMQPALIAAELEKVGVRFEQWQANAPITPATSNEAILAAYADDINTLKTEQGYITVDVISLSSSHPEKAAFRQKFLSEHTHSEDEVRFFVRGQGLFCLHIQNKIYQVLCVKNDLISVPAGTPHWFDMGSEPDFTAIRLFNNNEGWVANFTGSSIASDFPLLN